MVRTPKKSLTRGAQKPIRINKSRVAPLSSSVQVGAQSRPGRSKRCFLMNMIRMVEAFNLFLAVLFTLAYAYQLVYLFLGLIRRKHWKQPEAAQLHRYAAVISARNEAGVIGELIHTLKQQNYPTDLLDVYVVADNCTDDTAQVSRRAGAIVYERFNQHKKGKGYALDYLFRTLAHEGRDQYDGYLIFDADNLVDPNFVSEMNKVFDSGNYGAITCYRNSRNFGANWISAGYAIWFLREARFLNFPRMLLGTNCHVSGTGFLISALIRFPLINTAVLPALFIASGLSAGAAAAKLVAVGCFGEEEHSADMKLLHGAEWPIMAAEALCIFMIAVSLISGNAAAQAAVEAFVSGTWSTVFWVGVVGVGFVLPVLLNFVKSTASFYLAGLCSVVGMLCLRHFILYAGQIFGL